MGLNPKSRRTLLASAARTATTVANNNGSPFREHFKQKMRMFLNVTAASGTGGLQPQVRAYDPLSGAATAITTGGTAVTATGLYIYELGLAEATPAGNVKECDSRPLPTLWDVQVVAGDSSSYTYSLSCEVLE